MYVRKRMRGVTKQLLKKGVSDLSFHLMDFVLKEEVRGQSDIILNSSRLFWDSLSLENDMKLSSRENAT